MTRLTKEFQADFPDTTQSGGIRFVARKFQQVLEKNTPAYSDLPQFSGDGLTGVQSLPGRGASGESSN